MWLLDLYTCVFLSLREQRLVPTGTWPPTWDLCSLLLSLESAVFERRPGARPGPSVTGLYPQLLRRQRQEDEEFKASLGYNWGKSDWT